MQTKDSWHDDWLLRDIANKWSAIEFAKYHGCFDDVCREKELTP